MTRRIFDPERGRHAESEKYAIKAKTTHGSRCRNGSISRNGNEIDSIEQIPIFKENKIIGFYWG